VQWAPGPLAGVFATATFEGQVGISSLSSCTAVGGEADGFSFGQGESCLLPHCFTYARIKGIPLSLVSSQALSLVCGSNRLLPFH
jgi:hypothetical protein